jgi:CrcB protein
VNVSALRELLLVGGGGFLGSVCRYALSGAVHRILPQVAMPVGTMTVNVLGCGAIGVIAGMTEARQLLGPGIRLFLYLGVLGGFTTFSTFGYETLALVRGGEHYRAVINVVSTLALCLIAVWLGHELGSAR